MLLTSENQFCLFLIREVPVCTPAALYGWYKIVFGLPTNESSSDSVKCFRTSAVCL